MIRLPKTARRKARVDVIDEGIDGLPVSRKTPLADFTIHSLESGKEGRVLLLLHGLAGSSR